MRVEHSGHFPRRLPGKSTNNQGRRRVDVDGRTVWAEYMFMHGWLRAAGVYYVLNETQSVTLHSLKLSSQFAAQLV